MSLVNYSFTAIIDEDSGGANRVASQAVEVRNEIDATLATIYSDSAGASPITQPSTGAQTDSNGVFEFWVEAGIYTIASGSRTETKIIDNGSRLSKDTLTELLASKHVRENDIVSYAERTTGNGGGGGGHFISGTGTANGYNIIAHDTLSLSFVLRMGAVYNASQLGVVQGTVTDNYAAITAIIALMSDGYSLEFDAGYTYRFDTGIVVTDKSINILAEGATFDFSNNTDTLGVAFNIKGSASATTTTATTAILQGAPSITVASETGFSAGDWIEIKSNNQLLATTATYLRGELGRVRSTAANTLNLEGGTKIDYSISGSVVTITKLNMIDSPKIKGGLVIGDGLSATQHIGIAMAYAVAPVIKETHILDCASTGMDYDHCVFGLMEKCHVDNTNATTPTTTGYSYSHTSFSEYCIVNNCTAERYRHAYTTGGLFPVWNWKVSDCNFAHQIEGLTTFSVFTHSNGANGEMSNCNFDSGYGGVSFGGPGNKLTGGIFSNMGAAGAASLDFDGPKGGVIDGITAYGPVGIGVGAYTDTANGASIINNTLIAVATNGATIAGGISATGDNSTVQGNRLFGFSHAASIAGSNSILKDNAAYNTTNTSAPYAFRVLSGTDCSVEGNITRNPASSTYTNSLLISAGVVTCTVKRNDFTGGAGPEISDAGTNSVITDDNILDGQLRGLESVTAARLNDITDVINTNSRAKNLGVFVLNFDTGLPVRPVNSTAGGVWVTAAGATSNTPA